MLVDVHVGQVARFGALTVFPLFRESTDAVDYLLSGEALKTGAATVSEVSAQGSVPELIVENNAPQRVLFLEGEELRGAKQNRILNASMLIPAMSKLKIPVSCVEQGRWRRTSAFFAASYAISPYRLRHSLRASVSRSLKEKRGHRSDQGKVWEEVRRQHDALGVASPTAALADAYEKHQQSLDAARKSLKYVEGSSGLAVAIGSRVVSVDIYDKPATCEKVWDRLLSGIALDALSDGGQIGAKADTTQVIGFLADARNACWMQTAAVGEGEEYRAEFGGNLGSALVLEGSLIHGSVLAAV